MSVKRQVNSKSHSELDIGGRETCLLYVWTWRNLCDINELFSKEVLTHLQIDSLL